MVTPNRYDTTPLVASICVNLGMVVQQPELDASWDALAANIYRLLLDGLEIRDSDWIRCVAALKTVMIQFMQSFCYCQWENSPPLVVTLAIQPGIAYKQYLLNVTAFTAESTFADRYKEHIDRLANALASFNVKLELVVYAPIHCSL